MKVRPLQLVLLFVVGGILVTLLDAIHTHTETLIYARPDFFMAAWWVPFLMGGMVVTIALSHVYADQKLRQPVKERPWRDILIGLTVLSALYVFSGVFKGNVLFKFFILNLGVLAVWWIWDRSSHGLMLGIVTATLGCFAEISMIQREVFFYFEPDFFGIPNWLPFLYFAGSVTVGNLGRKLFVGAAP